MKEVAEVTVITLVVFYLNSKIIGRKIDIRGIENKIAPLTLENNPQSKFNIQIGKFDIISAIE